MNLKNLTLINFRKFKNTTIEFLDGVTGVIGLNGTGKSTIFEAIAWVLYGSVAARTASDEIKRQGAEKNEPCRVELDFIFEENSYRIIREMQGKNLTTNATVTINGKIAATSAEAVTKYIQKKLGMDFKSFFTSIFAKQKELNTLSSMNASERRPLILKMLGIDSLDDVIKEIKSDKRQKDSFIEKLNSDLTDESGESKISIHKNQIKNYEKEKTENENIIKKSTEQINKSEKELKQINKNCENTKKEYEKIQEKKEKLTEKKTQFENKEKLLGEIKNLKNKTKERQTKIKSYEEKLKKFTKTIEDLKNCEKRLKDIDKKNKEYIKKTQEKHTLIKRLQIDIKEINSKKEKIKKLGPEAECPTCERTLADQYNNLISKFLKEISSKEAMQKFEKAQAKQQKHTIKEVKKKETMPIRKALEK